MKIIKIIPMKKFGGSWCAEEALGVAPCFPGPNGRQYAIDYAQNRFGGTVGEIQVCDEAGDRAGDRLLICCSGVSHGSPPPPDDASAGSARAREMAASAALAEIICVLRDMTVLVDLCVMFGPIM